MATGMFENDAGGNCLQQQAPPGVPDSPDSIPLPDSPPPEAEERGQHQGTTEESIPPDEHNTEDETPQNPTDFVASNNSSHNPPRGSRKSSSRKPRLAEEYDPSEPLTSSDEEEHSIQLIEGGSRKSNSSSEFKNTRSEPRKSNSSSSNSNSALELGRSTSPKPYKLSSTPPPSVSSVSRTSTNKPLSPKATQEQRPAAINSNSTSNSSNNVSNVSNSNRLDLNSIPVPPEENRRPVIHFSIPTRHKLLPISSLIKRQKGNAKKDGRSDAGNGQQSEPRGLDRGQEGDDEDDEDDLDDCNRPKISLVAEIFGNDDDDDDENEEETDQFQQTSAESKNKNADDLRESLCGTLIGNTVAESDAQQQNIDKAPNTQIDSNSGRWKIVADEANVPLSITDAPAAAPSGSINTTPAAESPKAVVEPPKDIIDTTEDEPEIIEIVTINVPTNNRLRPLRRRPFLSRLGLENGGEPEVIEIDQNDDDEVPVEVNTASASNEQSSAATSVPPPARQPSPPPSPVAEGPKESNKESNKESHKESHKERMLRPVDSSPERERHFKRPHSSSSMSNCEEGEIIDQVNPSKKRKKDKKKKTKRRKRSKDSVSPPKLPEKRLSDNNPPTASSDHEDSGGGRNAISWRKPSKRSQNRNYRDGKPKADDTFFREKEQEDKRRSDSPRRNRPAGRKDKSPNREKSGKLRREGSARNRSHSKSPGGKDSRSRSRSGGRPYRSRRRNRNSRSKSTNSLSDKSRSGRSSSRRRSRRRYRRSNSRHRVGDSRSPSYITEPIRSRSSHYSKLRDRSRSRSRDRHTRGRHRKNTISRSRSVSLSRAMKKTKKPESVDRQQRKKQTKEKEKPFDCGTSDAKEKRKEKEKLKEKEKEKRKKKEKPKEEEKVKPKEKVKEKEKRKKRKRREKSPTPVKAIVADGDSIVVSLSFQKGKTAASSSNAQPSASTEHRKETGMDTSENSEPTGKQLGKGNNEPPQDNEFNDEAERSQNSPAKLSSVTDDEGNTSPVEPCPTERSKAEEKETEAVKVTSTGGGSTSPFEAERSFSAAADSTKIVTPQQSEQLESSFSHSRSSMSPNDVECNAQGDSLVTSTGDSMDPPLVADESSKSNSSSTTPSKQVPGLSHKISTSAVSPRFQATQTTTTTESIVVPSASAALTSTTTSNSQNSVTPTRPLIGNIPGLYPSSAIISSGGAVPVPPPIVIPTPPPPQGIRFSGSSASAPMLNPNVLASVASALLAVRQNQPGKVSGAGGVGCSDTGNSQLRHVNVLGPRTQNFNLQSNTRHSGNNFSQGQEQSGDSPMSPNSSDGDDLFEPPTERSQGDANGGGKLNKNGQHLGNASLTGNNSNAPNKSKERGGLFDTLFGNPEPKKTAANKPEKTKSKGKHNRKGAKKETIKVNTSGGLTEGELRLTDEVPTSAVELIVKQKYLKKLNRQERVVEEVKLSLKPYYSKRQVNKDEYKEILRRAVPKICHNKTGEINPGKIKELVEAYVKKFRHARKRGVDISSIN